MSTMYLSSLLALAAGALAVTAPGPAPTDPAADALGLENGFTPKPTASPLLPALGYVDSSNLFARQQPLFTCGFESGDVASPLVCGTSSACSFGSGPDYYFGCCEFTGSVSDNTWDGTYGSDCYTIADCVEYDDHPYTISGASLLGDEVLCGAYARYCATSYISDVPGYSGDSGGYYTHYDCVSAISSGDVLFYDWSSTDESDFSTTRPYYGYTTSSQTSTRTTGTTTRRTSSTSISVQTVVSISLVTPTPESSVGAVGAGATSLSSTTTTSGNGAMATERSLGSGMAGLVAVVGVAMIL